MLVLSRYALYGYVLTYIELSWDAEIELFVILMRFWIVDLSSVLLHDSICEPPSRITNDITKHNRLITRIESENTR